MRVARALLRRSAAQSGQLAAALAIATVGCAALVVLLVVPAAGIDRGVATLLADAEPTAGALRVETALADDTAAQEAEFDEAFASALGDAPLDVVRAVRSAPLTVGFDGAERQLVLGSQQDLADLATLTAGDWPAADDEVTLAEPAADALGVTVGDTLELPRGTRTIVGIWRALDTGDAAWFSETLVASGRLGDAVGPVIVAESDLAGLESRPRVTWTLVPREVDANTIGQLAPVEGRVRAATSGLASGTSYAVSLSGELSRTVARAEAAVASARVLSGTAVVLALAASGIVLALVGRSLGQVRALEAALLTARGLSPSRAAVMALVEAAVVVGVGTGLGVGVAALIAASAHAGLQPDAVLAAVAAGLMGVVLLAVAGRPAQAEQGGRSVAETDSIVPALGMVGLAAFALVTAATVPASPVRFIAPALALVAGVLLLRLLLAPAMRLAERLAARSTALLPVLPLRQLGRRPRAVASAFVVVALAAGAIVVAGLAAGTAAREHDAGVTSAVGGQLRIAFTGTDRDPVSAAPYARLEGVTAVTEVALVAAGSGSASLELVVADADFATVTGARPLAADTAEPLPVRVAPALASRLGVGLGDAVPLTIPGERSPLPAVIAQIAPVPGTGGGGMLVSRAALADRLPPEQAALVVDEVWVRTSTPEATAALARAVTDRPATMLTPAGADSLAVAAAGVTATAVAAGLVVLMGVGGLAASAAALRRLRRGEVLPLRALGVGAASQARGRFVELALTSLAGIVAGAVAGVLASLLATGAADFEGEASAVPLVLTAALLLGVLVVAVIAALAVSRDAGVRS
ncbi:MAG TPA: hypothetical protein VL043_11680 [Protaetiibacter sp.]|nr:hypothetical protein [Protaetiibacter sp.]